jgi:hypothetical protein
MQKAIGDQERALLLVKLARLRGIDGVQGKEDHLVLCTISPVVSSQGFILPLTISPGRESR